VKVKDTKFVDQISSKYWIQLGVLSEKQSDTPKIIKQWKAEADGQNFRHGAK
jgi:hypothetical protein